MAHACLMKSASNTLLRNEQLVPEDEPALRAARHARQMQDTSHSMEIYLRVKLSIETTFFAQLPLVLNV